MFLFFHFNWILQTGMLWKLLAKKASSASNHFIFFCLLFCSRCGPWFFRHFFKGLENIFFQTACYSEWWDPRRTHNFRPKLQQFWLFHMWDFCLYFILWALFTGLKGTVSGTSEHQSGVATFESEFDDRFNFFFSAQFCCVVTTVVLAADFEVKWRSLFCVCSINLCCDVAAHLLDEFVWQHC